MGTSIKPPELPDIGTLSYNGVLWSALYHSKMDGTPEYARDKRSVKYHKLTFTADGVIFADDQFGVQASANSATTDPLMLKLRYLLTRNGKPLIIRSKGYGNIIVNAANTPGSTWDVAYGPHPELLAFQPMGEGKSALVSWKVTFHIAEYIPAPLTNQFGILAFTRSDDISYDDKGYMTYSTNGELEISSTVSNVLNRSGQLQNRDFANNYQRAYLDPLVPEGFKPQRRDFKFSEDQRTCTFNFSWEEMKIGGLPVACMDANGDYSWGNTNRGFAQWDMNLRASYWVRKDVRRNSAYLRFLGLYRAKSPLRFGLGTDLAKSVILTKFRGSEGLYSDSGQTSFEASWLQTSPLAQILVDSSMWRPVPDSDYTLWRFGGQLNEAGPQGLRITNTPPANGNVSGMNPICGFRSWTIDNTFNDVNAIIDITHQPSNNRMLPTYLLNRDLRDFLGDLDEKDHPAFRTMRGVPNTPQLLARLAFMNLPSAKNSWLDYYCEVYTELDPGLAIHKPLPQNNDPADTLATLDYQSNGYAANTNDYNVKSQSTGADIVQRMATSTYKVCLRGFAYRAGYPIPIPGVVNFNGVKPTPQNPHKVWRVSTSNISGIPIYQARWELWYTCSVPPKQAVADPYPQNPASQLGPILQRAIPQSIPVPQGVFGVQVQNEYTRELQRSIPK